MRPVLSGLAFVILLLSSCEKAEQPVRLPERGTSQYTDNVHMGEDYLDQIFFNLAENKVVYTSLINSWDLAFETTPTGYHVYVNTGKNILAHNTGQTDMTSVNKPPAIKDTVWRNDGADGLPENTAIGEWRLPNGQSKNEVYVLKFDTSVLSPGYLKMTINSCSPTEYLISFSDLENNNIVNKSVLKQENYNFTYFSFSEGVVYPEPVKDSWDIVFTRYRILFPKEGIFYSVTGALLNPYKTTGVRVGMDEEYPQVNINALDSVKLSKNRDVIGHSWKTYVLSQSKYIIDQGMVYIINDKNNFYWKLHFLDFYDKGGRKGSPAFEYERLQ